MNDILTVFFLVSGVVALVVIWWGIVHLISGAGNRRENVLLVVRGVLILALIALITEL